MLKKLVFLGMGGTIAGSSDSSTDNVGYKAGQVCVTDLLEVIAGLQSVLGDHQLVSEQVAQLDSKDLGHGHWKALALRVVHFLTAADVSALVITHGTDTLEETAFFLSRVLPFELLASKSVVLTCAMRPASSSAPDGPQNVLDAVATALSPAARGVLVVCAGVVHSARDVQKVHPYRVSAFDSGDSGPLGFVEERVVRWVHPCGDASAAAKAFPLEKLALGTWPWVEIVLSHAGVTGAVVRALCSYSKGAAPLLGGIVVAGTGNGTIHHDLEAALREAQKQGVRVVRSTRCAQGCVVPGSAVFEFAHSMGLSPVKARIALMLDLMQQGKSTP
ncbi:MAG: asparaginase [Burkholderiales bacterium]